MSDRDVDILSLGENSDDNLDSDLPDNVDKIHTRSESTRGKPRVRSGFKRKASEASVKPPKKRSVTKKTTESEQCLDIDSLKSSLGIDSILKTLTVSQTQLRN